MATNVQATGNVADNTTSVSQAFSVNVTAGNLLIIYGQKYTPSGDVFLAADCTKSAGTATIGTVTLDQELQFLDTNSNRLCTGIWSVPVTGSGSCTMQISGAVAGSYLIIGIQEANGLDTSSSRVYNSVESSANTGAPDSGNITSTGGGMFAGVLCTDTGSNTTHTIDSAFTTVYESEDGTTHQTGSSGFRFVTSATTDSASWTAPTTIPYAAGLVFYKESASTAFTISVSDTIGNSESVTISIGTPAVNKSESVAVSESVSVSIVTGTLTVNVSDNIALTESKSASVGSSQINVSDSISLSESDSVSLPSGTTLTISVSDEIIIIEGMFYGNTEPTISASDSVSVSESVSATVGNPQINKSESVAVSESATSIINVTISKTESITVSEAATISTVSMAVSVSDTVLVSESVSASVITAGTYAVSQSDGVTVTESYSLSIASLTVSVSDSIALTESNAASIVAAGTNTISASDAVLVTDTPSLQIGVLAISVSDTISTSDLAALFIVTSTVFMSRNNAAVIQFRDKRGYSLFRDKRAKAE